MFYTITINNLITNIKECDWLTKNDLFVEIEFGKEKRRTMVKWNDNKPSWNESFIFNVDLNKFQSFLLTINDADNYSKNEKIVSEKIKINNSAVVSNETDYLSITHGISDYNLYNIIDELKAEKTTLKNYNHRLINDVDKLKSKITHCETNIKDMKDFLFGMKKNIIKVLSNNNSNLE
tara:strand:+ start:151 stop:684 length:534 start_codon:yes stop_codon:yes gene_type:complete